MSNEIKLYENNGALATINGDNYTVKAPGGGSVELIRSHKDEKGQDLADGDFGVIPGTGKPSLFKSGADKIRILYGFFERHTPIVELCECDSENGFIRHVDKCELVKLNPQTGQEYVFASYVASANNREKRNGTSAGSMQVDNNCVKMAEKRSMVSAVISVANLSNLFTMDVEDMKLEKAYKATVENIKNEFINKKYLDKFWVEVGKTHTKDEVAAMLKQVGYESSKEIKKKDFGDVLDFISGKLTKEEFLSKRDGDEQTEDPKA